MAQHIVHLFGRGEFGGKDEVAFVFTVFVVDYDDETALLEIFYGLFDGGKWGIFHIIYIWI